MALFSRGDRPDPGELRATPLFDGLNDDELEAACRLAKRRTFAAGDKLIDQGRYGVAFYLISEGRALVYIGDTYVTAVGPGSAVGEMALVEHRPRNATVIAEADMVVAEFGIAEFNKLLDRYPSARLRILELLNARLHENQTRDQSD